MNKKHPIILFLLTIFLTILSANSQACTVAPDPDLNNDGIVDKNDLVIVTRSNGLKTSHPRYNPQADTNCDGKVNPADIHFVNKALGETFSIEPDVPPVSDDVQINLINMSSGGQFVVDNYKGLTTAIDFMTSEVDTPYTVKIAQSISPASGLTVTPILDGSEFTYSKNTIDKHEQAVRATDAGEYEVTTVATIVETGDTSTHVAKYKVLPVDAPNIHISSPSIQLEGAINYLDALKPNSIVRVTMGVGSASGKDYDKVTGMTVIEPDRGFEAILNDDGLGSDDESGNRVYGSHVVEINTMGMESGECLHFYTIVSTTKGDVTSPYSEDICVSSLIFDKPYIEDDQDVIRNGTRTPYSRGTISVSFIKGTTDARILEIVESINGTIVDSNLTFMSFTVKLNQRPSIEEASDVIHQISRELESFPEVTKAGFTIFAQPLSIYTDDPLYHSADIPFETGDLHAISQAGVDEAWYVVRGKQPIAILDSGIDKTHEDLKNKIITESAYNTAENNKDIKDFNHHGSHVAGIAAAQSNNGLGIAGVSWDSKIIPIKIYPGSEVKGLTAELMANAIKYAARIKALKIINFSSGFEVATFTLICKAHVFQRLEQGLPISDPECIEQAKEIEKTAKGRNEICKAVDFAIKNEKIFISAAGNNSRSNKFYPAACDNVISVAAVEPSDIFDFSSDLVRWFGVFWSGSPSGLIGSQYGSWITIAAPGSQVLSTVPKETCNFLTKLFFPCLDTVYGYQHLSGTSQAAPIVAGAAAVILAKYPDYSRQQVEDRLKKSAFPMPGEGLGAGALDVFEAVFNGNFELVKPDTNEPEEWEKYTLASKACESKQAELGLLPVDVEHNQRMLVCDNTAVFSVGSMNTIDLPEGVIELPISFDWRIVGEDLDLEGGLPGKDIPYCNSAGCIDRFMPRNDFVLVQLIKVIEEGGTASERTTLFRTSLVELDSSKLTPNATNGWLQTDWQHFSETIPITTGAGKYTLRIQMYHSGFTSFDPTASISQEGVTLFMMDQLRFREI